MNITRFYLDDQLSKRVFPGIFQILDEGINILFVKVSASVHIRLCPLFQRELIYVLTLIDPLL